MSVPTSRQGLRIGAEHNARPPRRAALVLIAWTVTTAALTGCAGTPEPDPRYRPAESVLEVIAVLRRHVPDDTYRFEAAQDFTGRNVYRSSLLRLESMERLHSRAMMAAGMDGVVTFAKGRALERLRAFELAAQSYELAAELDAELALEARHSADICNELRAALALSIGLDELASDVSISPDCDAVLERFVARTRRLE